MMNANLVRNLSFYARRIRLSPTRIFFSSRSNQPSPSHTHNKDDSLLQDITNQELKRRVAKLQEGDPEAIPSVFEAILQRYLTGKPIEADQELMREILGKGTVSEDDEEDELDSDLEAINDADDEDEEDFDLDFKGRSRADK
ncbi:hypothetical protein VNO77_33128 [Canavalia gladiata]|uniref:Uncharacterized protein n=1 Tax=Canavalia gladiata TaxID=3824 RepID=A0AAN9PXF7_CANGL